MKLCMLILSLFYSFNMLAHGGHGGSSKITIEDELAQGAHLHLPIRIEPSGEILFGYEWPWSNGDDVDSAHIENGEHENDLDHDHENEGHASEELDESNKEHDHEHKFHIAPSLIIGGDYINRVISLDKKTEELNSFNGLIKADSSKGFVHIKRTQLLTGVGLVLDKHLSVAPFGTGLGLSYLKHHTAYSQTILKNLNEKERVLKIPGDIHEFRKWRNDERLSYVSQGTLVFTAGVGIDPLIHGGVIAATSGAWLVKLYKIDDEHLGLSLNSIKINSFGVEVDGSIMTLSSERFKSFEKGMSFKFNLKSKSAIDALKKVINGDLRTAEELSQLKIGVTKLNKDDGFSLGVAKSANVNIPFLIGFGFSNSKVESFNSGFDYVENSDSKVVTSIVSKEESSRGILSNHKKELMLFATTHTDESHDDHRDQYYTASFKWHYEKDDVKARTINNKVQELYLKTGIEELKKLEFRNLGEDKLGYFRVSFDVSLTESDLFNLIRLFSNENISTIEKKVNFFISKEVELSNLLIYCPEYVNQEVFHDNVSECRNKILRNSVNHFLKLKEKSKNILKINKNTSKTLAVSQISELGFALFRSPFIFKAIRNELFDSEFVLNIEGEKVQGQVIRFSLL